MRRTLWIIPITLVIAIIVGAASFWAFTTPICTLPDASELRYGCLEFWVNRYQALIAGLFALAAAAIAAWPVLKQTKTVGAQAAMDLLAIVEREAEQIAAEKEFLGAVWSLLMQLDEALHRFELNASTKQQVDSAFSDVEETDFNRGRILLSRLTIGQSERLKRGTLLGRLSLFRVVAADSRNAIIDSDFNYTVVKSVVKSHEGELRTMVTEIRSILDSLNSEEGDLRKRAVRLRRAAALIPG
jgi:hypothetical protein